MHASDAQHIVSIRFVDHWLRAQDEAASEPQEDLHEVRIRNPAALDEDLKMRRFACMRAVFVSQLVCGKVRSL